MAFTVVHRDGSRTDDPPLTDLRPLVDELSDGSGAVGVRHASGWALTVHGDGVAELDNDLQDDVPTRHVRPIEPAALGELIEAIAVGFFYEALEHPWQDGPRPTSAPPG